MKSKLEKNILAEDDMLAFAARLAKCTPPGTVIYFHGQLGAGKTTFIRGFLRGLGYLEKVKSPTYTLVEPYEVNNQNIFHFDLYRLQHADELQHIGFQEYFSSDAICLVEWPDKGNPLLPNPDLTINIEIMGEAARKLQLQAHSLLGEKILQQL